MPGRKEDLLGAVCCPDSSFLSRTFFRCLLRFASAPELYPPQASVRQQDRSPT